MVLQEVEGSCAAVAFDSNGDEMVSRRPLRGVDTESILRLAHVVEVGRQFRASALEILMQQTAEVIEKINVCAAVDVLIERVGLIDGGLILGNGVARGEVGSESYSVVFGRSRNSARKEVLPPTQPRAARYAILAKASSQYSLSLANAKERYRSQP